MKVKLICCLLALCFLIGCAGPKTDDGEPALPDIDENAYGGTELVARPAADNVFSLNFDPTAGTNPIRVTNATNLQVAPLIYEFLFYVDEDFSTVTSGLVTDYRTDDFIWWTFTIDTTHSFSDGSPLTAKDIAYSIRVAQQSDYYASHLRDVYGASDLGDGTLAVSVNKANSQLPAMLNIPIIPYGAYNEEFPLGSGPYQLSATHGALVLNEANSRAGDMPVDRIYLRDYMDPTERITAFEEGLLDLVTNDPAGMYNLGYGSVKETRYYDTTNLHYIGFNTRGNYFQSYLVRCAVGYLVDRDYVVKGLMNGYGAAAALPCHPRSPLYDAEYAARFTYDPEMAATLFREGGVDDLDDDGKLEILVTGIIVELNIKFIVNTDSSVKVTAARRITDELNALGITTTLYELDWDEYLYALNNGDFDMYYGELRLPVDWDIRPLFDVPSESARRQGLWGMNYSHTLDTAYSAAYDAYLAADETERYQKFQDASHYVVDSGFLIPICFERREMLTHRDAVGGAHPTQWDLFNRFDEWTINLDS